MSALEKEELDFLRRFIIESDAIEGIDNDLEKLTAQLVRQEYPSGHAGAMVMLHNAGSYTRIWQLSELLVHCTQELIVSEQHLKGERELPMHERGQWRTRNVALVTTNRHGEEVSRKPIGAEAILVPSVMAALIDRVVRWQRRRFPEDGHEDDRAKVRFIARFHWEYERIHPFADGNGRSGRALVYYLYRYAGLEPFVFTNIGKRENYYPCFGDKTGSLMEQYFLDRSLATR